MPSGKRRVSSREKAHVKEEKKDGKVVFFKVIAILFMIFLGIEAVIYAFLVPCFGIPRVEYKAIARDFNPYRGYFFIIDVLFFNSA